jgi:UDP-3-O-[3-hydroxymyristoyl] glucosamine N-acyltransferase
VHITHNVEIGRHCALTVGTIIGGSTRIGDMCWTGLNSTIKHKVKIGNKVIIDSGASVINNIDDEDIVARVPAKSIKHKVRSNQLFLMAAIEASVALSVIWMRNVRGTIPLVLKRRFRRRE